MVVHTSFHSAPKKIQKLENIFRLFFKQHNRRTYPRLMMCLHHSEKDVCLKSVTPSFCVLVHELLYKIKKKAQIKEKTHFRLNIDLRMLVEISFSLYINLWLPETFI